LQLAIAKSRQYDEFFRRIASENELVASYAQTISEIEGCTAPPGIWVAPTGSNKTLSLRREATIRSLCGPSMIMQGLHEAESSFYLSYIGTEDGALAVWPYSDKTLSNTAPFNYKDMPIILRPGRRRNPYGPVLIWTKKEIPPLQLPLPSFGAMSSPALLEWIFHCIRFTMT